MHSDHALIDEEQGAEAEQFRSTIGGGNEYILITNSNNVLYTGPLYFGTPKQGNSSSKFMFDTSSITSAVTTTECTNCANQYFDPSLSSSFKLTSSEEKVLDYSFGKKSLTGYMGQDLVCLLDNKQDTCANLLEFCLITSQTNLNVDIDGVLGLSPYTDK